MLYKKGVYIMDTIMKAVHLMDNKQTEEALQLLDNHLLVTDDDKKYTIAELYLQWGLNEKAQSILQDLLHRYPEENDIKIMLADIYIGLEDDQSAINLLSEIDANDPSYLQALLQMADLYEAQGLFEVAELKLLEAKQINPKDRKSTRLNSSHVAISYAVFCLKKKKQKTIYRRE